MKTIRLFYPDHLSGGLDTYYFGAHLMTQILPENSNQILVKVPIAEPEHHEESIEAGIYAKTKVIDGIRSARNQIEEHRPDRIITIGGNCIVSLSPFDYLHGLYPNAGILWIDAHPDVSTENDGYPNAHAMVLGALLNHGPQSLRQEVKHGFFKPESVMYLGLQSLHNYQKSYLDGLGVDYKIQSESFISEQELTSFVKKFSHILVHFDIDVLDEHLFHSTYFANPELKGDGAGGGRMTMEILSRYMKLINDNAEIAGFTIAEYLPFDEHRLNKMFNNLDIFKDK